MLRLRRETSQIQEQLVAKQREFEKATAELDRLQFEDNVDEMRREASVKVTDAQDQVAQKKSQYEATCMYYFTLEHMYKRLRDGKQHHISTLQVLEDALRVQKQEQSLQERLLASVMKAYTQEKRDLSEAQAEVAQHHKLLSEKLETRRQEVQARRRLMLEKAAAAKKEATLNARAAGDLTAAEEAALRARTMELQQEEAMLSYRKQVLAQTVDDLYDLFSRVRIAAGVPQSELPEGCDATELPPPRPDDIVEAFVQQQAELSRVSDRLQALNERLAYLAKAEVELRNKMQPEARNHWDEDGFDPHTLVTIESERDAAKRKLEATQKEFEDLRGVKVQFDQALDSMHAQCSLAPTPALGSASLKDLPPGTSMWAAGAVQKVLEVKNTLQYLLRVVRAAVHGEGEGGAETLDIDSREMEARMGDMVVANRRIVRVQPTAAGASIRSGHETVHSAVIHNTAHQFANTHSKFMKSMESTRQASSTPEVDTPQETLGIPTPAGHGRRGSFGGESVASTDTGLTGGIPGRPLTRDSTRRGRMDPFSKDASLTRRKGTLIEIQGALAQAYAEVGDVRVSGSGAQAAKAKHKKGLKASGLTKFIASAMDMAGAEVDEFMLQTKEEPGEYRGRDRLKEDALRIASDKVRQRRLGEKMRLEAQSKNLQPSEALMT